jgi:hypothetical protein
MSFNRTRVAGHLDEIQGVVAITLNTFCNGAVGFIDRLDRWFHTTVMTSTPGTIFHPLRARRRRYVPQLV